MGVQRSSDSGMSTGSSETGGREMGSPVETQPRADLLKEGRLIVASAWSSGKSGRGSTFRDLMGAGLGALPKPPNGVATLHLTQCKCFHSCTLS